jgi:putative flippase GtrA
MAGRLASNMPVWLYSRSTTSDSSSMRFEIVKFGAVGAVSTLIDFLFLTLFVRLGTGLFLAIFFSYTIGAVNGYLLNNKWTFGHLNRPSTFRDFLRYASISFVGLGLTELIVYALYEAFHVPVSLDKLAAVAVVFLWNYFANRHFTFKVVQD